MRVTTKLIALTITIALVSCSDNRESIAKQFVAESVSSQSKGILDIISFKKTNGYKGDNPDSYIMEWEMVLKSKNEFWKIRLDNNFYWSNFVLETEQRAAEKTSMNWHNGLWLSAQSPVHFPTGKQIKLTGTVTFTDSEKGWITQGLIVKTSHELN